MAYNYWITYILLYFNLLIFNYLRYDCAGKKIYFLYIYTMIGIYKIKNPIGKVYIGQSINIERRFKSYVNLNCKKQIILYNSFLKHGVNNHKFEILCECEVSELNDKERYYQDLYSVVGKKGLNCVLTILNKDKRKQFFKDQKERHKENADKLKRKKITDILDSIMF